MTQRRARAGAAYVPTSAARDLRLGRVEQRSALDRFPSAASSEARPSASSANGTWSAKAITTAGSPSVRRAGRRMQQALDQLGREKGVHGQEREDPGRRDASMNAWT